MNNITSNVSKWWNHPVRTEVKVPDYLRILIEQKRWPSSNKQAFQNGKMFPLDLIQRVAPEERHLILFPPSFFWMHDTSYSCDLGVPDFVNPPGNIDPRKAVVIADFGVGSETLMALDFRNGQEPNVIRSVWINETKSVKWRFVASNFMQFARLIDL